MRECHITVWLRQQLKKLFNEKGPSESTRVVCEYDAIEDCFLHQMDLRQYLNFKNVPEGTKQENQYCGR